MDIYKHQTEAGRLIVGTYFDMREYYAVHGQPDPSEWERQVQPLWDIRETWRDPNRQVKHLPALRRLLVLLDYIGQEYGPHELSATNDALLSTSYRWRDGHLWERDNFTGVWREVAHPKCIAQVMRKIGCTPEWAKEQLREAQKEAQLAF